MSHKWLLFIALHLSVLFSIMHPRNPHSGRYDFQALCQISPELTAFVKKSPRGDCTINFSDPKAVIALNRAILANDYGIKCWSIPAGFLCPPIPGRADYIHYLADLIKQDHSKPKTNQVRAIDIGTGANCIYPILGHQSYGWQFVATDINPHAIRAAKQNVNKNPQLKGGIKVVQQIDPNAIFRGVVMPEDRFDVSLCNPPFHRSAQEALAGTSRKVNNLSNRRGGHNKVALNFGGQAQELWCEGGELSFLKRMATESRQYAKQIRFFTSLVSKSDTLRPMKKRLKELDATLIEVIEMNQGHKISRILVWSFQTL